MTVVSLGTFGRNETPLDLVYAFRDAAGDPINLTGATIKVRYIDPYGQAAEIFGYVADATAGEAGMAWVTDMTDQPGPWSMTIWADLSGQTIGSATIVYNVTTQTAPAAF